MSESRQSFTVKDRRQFTPDGDRRPDPEATPAASAEQEPSAQGEPGASADEPVEFAAFLVSLAAQAGALLAPAEGQPELGAARQIIGILEMLKDKTQGRRTEEEDRVLESLLYQLRMAYLEVSRGARA